METPTLEAVRLPDADLNPVPWALMLKLEPLARALPTLRDRDNRAGMSWRREEGSILTRELGGELPGTRRGGKMEERSGDYGRQLYALFAGVIIYAHRRRVSMSC